MNSHCSKCGRELSTGFTCGCEDHSGVSSSVVIDVRGYMTYGQAQKIIELLGEILNELEQIRFGVRGFE